MHRGLWLRGRGGRRERLWVRLRRLLIHRAVVQRGLWCKEGCGCAGRGGRRGQRLGRAAATGAGGLWCRGLWLCGARVGPEPLQVVGHRPGPAVHVLLQLLRRPERRGRGEDCQGEDHDPRLGGTAAAPKKACQPPFNRALIPFKRRPTRAAVPLQRATVLQRGVPRLLVGLVKVTRAHVSPTVPVVNRSQRQNWR